MGHWKFMCISIFAKFVKIDTASFQGLAVNLTFYTNATTYLCIYIYIYSLYVYAHIYGMCSAED